MRTWLSLFLIACGAPVPEGSTSASDGQQTSGTPPDVVIVTLDTVRADRLGCYGDPLARTPNLDRLASSSVLFRRAYTPVPLTLPAHTSLLSGWYPDRHGVRDNGGFRVAKEVPLLSEELSAKGYRTGAFVAAYVLDGAWGLDRGFDRYYDNFHPQDVARAARFGAVERPAREVIREALGWWEAPEQAGQPRFLWVHLFDAHTPYVAPVDWRGDPYRGEVFEVDRALKPLLDAVPDNAWVIVAADHGENLWDGGELEHGTVLSRSTLRVPLLIRPPGGARPGPAVPRLDLPPRPEAWKPVPGLTTDGLILDAVPDAPAAAWVVDEVVSLVDIAPTLRDYLGLSSVAADGVSLRPALSGETGSNRTIYAESVAPATHYGWAPQHIATNGQRLLWRDGVDEVYDPVADPWWVAPLAEAPPPALRALVEQHQQGWDRPGAPVDPATAQALAALGYTTGRSEQAGPRGRARDHIQVLHRLFLAQGQMASAPETAKASLESLVRDQPNLVDAWFSLATLRWSKRDADGALAALDEVVRTTPDHPLAWNNRVVILRESGRLEEALIVVERLAKENPKDVRWPRHRVDMLARLERPEAVREAAEAGIAAAGDDPFLHYMAGLAKVQTKDFSGAITSLTRARELGTEATDVNLWMGEAHRELGQVDEAVAAYKAQANATPHDLRPTVSAGLLLAQSNRCSDALPLLFTALQRGARSPQVQETYKKCGGM